jgi:hypothetical protein
MSNNSLTSRARFFATEPYRIMAESIPEQLLSKTGTSPFYGCIALPGAIHSRRKSFNIETTEDNLIIFESNKVYNKYADGLMPEVTRNCTMDTIKYEDHAVLNLTAYDPKFSLRNLPYQKPGQGRANLYPELIKNELKHGYEWTADILPTAWLRSDSGDLKQTRNIFLNKMGLYKIIVLPFDTFKDFGANLETAIYLCKKGYTGPIEVGHLGSTETYQYDFRSKDVIITPRSDEEVTFIFNCVKQSHYEVKGVGSAFKGVKATLSNTKTKTHQFPVIDKLKKTLKDCAIKYSDRQYDTDADKHRVVTSYLAAGWGKGDKHYGNLVYVPPGYQLTGTYKYIVVDDKVQADAIVFYLNTKLVRYLAHYWRTSRTCDQPQWNSIPKLTKFDLDTEDKILDHFISSDVLKEKIKNDRLHETGKEVKIKKTKADKSKQS